MSSFAFLIEKEISAIWELDCNIFLINKNIGYPTLSAGFED